MTETNPKLAREKKTISVMIRLYCHKHHSTAGDLLCEDCEELLQYAMVRLDKCPLGPEKGPCSKCEIHCYKPAMKKKIREVMRFSGPRMLSRHPALAVSHLMKEWKGKAANRKKGANS